MELHFIQTHSVLISVLLLCWYILVTAGLWKMFSKAHISGWKSLIPIYRFYLLFKLSWKPSMYWFWLLCYVAGSLIVGFTDNFMLLYFGMAISLVATIMNVVLMYNVSLAYGHGFGFFIGLMFLEPLFLIIIGLGSSKYAGNRYLAQQDL